MTRPGILQFTEWALILRKRALNSMYDIEIFKYRYFNIAKVAIF